MTITRTTTSTIAIIRTGYNDNNENNLNNNNFIYHNNEQQKSNLDGVFLSYIE